MSRKPLAGGRFRPSAVLFDVDGTLADTMTFHLQAWTECLAERYGFVLPTGDARTHAGKTRTILEALLERTVDEDESLDMHAFKEARYRALATGQLSLLMGLSEYLDALTTLDIPVALVTGADRINTAFVLEALGLAERFKTRVTIEEVTAAKPHPESFLTAAARLGVAAHLCLAHEDTPAGVRSAVGAGMRVAALTTTQSAVALCEAGTTWTVPDYQLWREASFKDGVIGSGFP